MYIDQKSGYQKLLLGKLEIEKWEATFESDNDKKLLKVFFDDEIKQKKQKKKMSMEDLVYIVFGRNSLEKVLERGLTERRKLNQDQPK